MSMHKKPLTPLEEEGLRLHGLDIGKPSQLSDVFRHGVAWAISQDPEKTACEVLRARLARYEDAEGRPLHIDVNKAARALCNRHADICGVDREDQWKTYSQDFIEDAATVLAALKAKPSGVFYTCIGKGGQYEYVGISDGAGISKGEQLQVYRCTSTGRVFHRECSDFSARMERLNQPASGGEPFKCDHAACVSLGEHHPFCEYVKQSIGGDDAERAAFEAWMCEGYAADEDMLKKSHEGRYFYAKPANMWSAWQARAALSAPSHGEQVREVATCSDCNDSHWRTVIDGDGIPRDEPCPCAAAPSAGSQGGDV